MKCTIFLFTFNFYMCAGHALHTQASARERHTRAYHTHAPHAYHTQRLKYSPDRALSILCGKAGENFLLEQYKFLTGNLSVTAFTWSINRPYPARFSTPSK